MATMLVRCVAVALSLLFACATAVVARGGDARDIPLVDQSGTAFRLRDLRGTPSVVTFVASRCSDACPIANVEFDRVRTQLRHDGIRARLITVTLDPKYDTPFVMSALARSFHADPRDWIFASGRVRDVQKLMKSLGVVAETGRAAYPDVHTTAVYVLDSQERLTRELLLSTNIAKGLEAALVTSVPRHVCGNAGNRCRHASGPSLIERYSAHVGESGDAKDCVEAEGKRLARATTEGSK